MASTPLTDAELTTVDLNAYRSTGELEQYQVEVERRLTDLNMEFAGLPFPPERQEEFAELTERRAETLRRLEELRSRERIVSSIGAQSTGRRESVDEAVFTSREARGSLKERDVYDLSTIRTSADPDQNRAAFVDRARRAVDLATFPHPSADSDKIREQLHRKLATIDDPVRFSQHIIRTGSPAYQRAFAKHLSQMPLTSEEQRALTLGTEGLLTVPFQLDPTIINTSDGVVNPIRSLARVETITGSKWQGVSSAGVTASYVAEATEATDDSPTLAQPEVETERAQAFIPFSIELGITWNSLQSEMAAMLQDAKDDLEAEKFVNGVGSASNEPAGIVQTLNPTSIIWTQATGNFGAEDVYALDTDPSGGNPLPPRFRPRAAILGNKAIYAKVRQFDTAGGATLWVRIGDGLPPELIGYPAYEMSTMDATVADGNDILLIGDFRHFLIVDRVGLTVEVVQHLFGANRRPTGQRGLYAYWMNSSLILADNAFRVLRVGEGS